MRKAMKQGLWSMLWAIALIHAGVDSSESKLAVLEIMNTTQVHRSFVESMPDRIITELVRHNQKDLVERQKIQEAMQELQLGAQGITEENNLKIGKWIGAERILMGTFSQFGSTYRLDLRMVNVQSGMILAAAEATTRGDLGAIVPDAIAELLKFYRGEPFGDTEDARVQPTPQLEPVVSAKLTTWGQAPQTDWAPSILTIKHRITLGLFTQKAIPFQRVRVFVDGTLVGTSPILKKINEDLVLFQGEIKAGNHQLKLEHGVVDKKGNWKRLFESQPEILTLYQRPLISTEVSYEMKVGNYAYEFELFRVN